MARLILDVESRGMFQFLLNALIGAYNRRTDALAKGMGAIALALSTPQDNSAEVQKQIDKYTAEIKQSTDALDAAVKSQQ